MLEDDDEGTNAPAAARGDDHARSKSDMAPKIIQEQGESDTDEEYVTDTAGGGYYDPRKPTDCSPGCVGLAQS